jgi:hypothetical protein
MTDRIKREARSPRGVGRTDRKARGRARPDRLLARGPRGAVAAARRLRADLRAPWRRQAAP